MFAAKSSSRKFCFLPEMCRMICEVNHRFFPVWKKSGDGQKAGLARKLSFAAKHCIGFAFYIFFIQMCKHVLNAQVSSPSSKRWPSTWHMLDIGRQTIIFYLARFQFVPHAAEAGSTVQNVTGRKPTMSSKNPMKWFSLARNARKFSERTQSMFPLMILPLLIN